MAPSPIKELSRMSVCVLNGARRRYSFELISWQQEKSSHRCCLFFIHLKNHAEVRGQKTKRSPADVRHRICAHQ